MKAVTAIQRNSNHKIHAIRQILIPVILVLLFGMILYKCNQFTKEPLTSTAGQTYERATVTAVTRDNLAEDGNRYGNQQVTVRINSGTYKGKSFSATSPSGQLFGATCKPGMHVIVILSASSGTQVATVYSQNRIPAILAFIGIFTAAVCLIGGRKGIMSIFGLVFAFTAILYLMFPAIYQGASPILMAVLVSVLTTVVTLGLLNGFSRKTWSAMLGTSFGVAVAGIAAALFGAAAGISGYNVTEIETLSYVGQHSNLQIGQLLFAGIVYVYFRCGTMDFQAGGFLAPHVSGSTAAILFFLMIGAGAVKAGVMPLHSWLPAAMVAPTPVSALLHAVAVVNAGAFALLRVVCYTFGPELSRQCGGSTVMVWLAAGTIILSSLIALQKTNLKARLAYSTVGQLSYLVLGICLLSPYSVQGALYHMVAHSFLKITLFMCAGAIMVTTHKTDIREMWGIGRRMPYTMAAFLTASLGIAGLPFLPAFLSKANLILGAAKEGKPVLIAVLAASALLSLTYLVPVGYLAFSFRRTELEFASGPVRIPMGKRGRGVFFADASPCLLAPLLITVGISFALGIAPDFGPRMMQMARMAAGSIFS